MTAEEILRREGIDEFAAIPLSQAAIRSAPTLARLGYFDGEKPKGSAFLFLAPYLSETALALSGSISAYAVPRDYHIYFKNLSQRLCAAFSERWPDGNFRGFADDSPISEVRTAAAAGLGVVGRNGLLLTKKYSSFVFIGEIICSLDASALPSGEKLPADDICGRCGLCEKACPSGAIGAHDMRLCLSSVSQKKKELDPAEAEKLKKYDVIWGCDRCQKVCPHTAAAVKSGNVYTKIPFFREELIPEPDADAINAMSDAEFASRAYSWRGRQTILRNMELINKTKTEPAKGKQ